MSRHLELTRITELEEQVERLEAELDETRMSLSEWKGRWVRAVLSALDGLSPDDLAYIGAELSTHDRDVLRRFLASAERP